MKAYFLLLTALVLSSFMVLRSLDEARAADSAPVACPMMAKACPDGSYVSASGPKCEFVCPAAKAVPEPADLTACKQDADCVIVPYSHCCGSTKRAINKADLSSYNAHPEWQKFDNAAQCAVMGACVPDKDITNVRCALTAGKETGTCQLAR